MKILALLFLTGLAFAVSSLTMVFGWGVTPQSWTIIVLGWIALLGTRLLATEIKP